jgi:RNA polymerase sigma-70 factor (ECF subfamily)
MKLSMGMGTPASDGEETFVRFLTEAEPRLRRALVALRGPEDGRDAVAEALMWAWEHWDRVRAMDNPVGYLYRVGQSRTRHPRRGLLPYRVGEARLPDIEPGLGPALAALTDAQRTAVVLVHGCDWSYQEVAEALEISRSSVGTHVARALARLRQQLEVDQDA